MRWSQFAVLILGLLATACGQNLPSAVKTELGDLGNQELALRFAQFKAKGTDCEAQGEGPRVIVTGFGLFQGSPSNISGVVVGSFADTEFTAAALSTKAPLEDTDPLGSVDSGALKADDFGARVINRQMTIDGNPYSICFIKLDVLWDLGAAIIVHEASLFQPEFILMSGLGADDFDAIWEGGALNRAAPLAGFNAEGRPVSSNKPRQPFAILPARPLGHETRLSWNNTELQAATDALIASIPTGQQDRFSSQAPKTARAHNDYICNNLSYIVNEAALGTSVELAGGFERNPAQIKLTWKAPHPPKIGFLHLPLRAQADRTAVQLWIKAYAAAIRVSTEQSLLEKNMQSWLE